LEIDAHRYVRDMRVFGKLISARNERIGTLGRMLDKAGNKIRRLIPSPSKQLFNPQDP
jgi:hypothetical protein